VSTTPLIFLVPGSTVQAFVSKVPDKSIIRTLSPTAGLVGRLIMITALVVSFVYIIFFKQIINILTDIELLRFISYKHFLWVIIIPPIASFCYQLDGIFIGASQTKEMRNAMIISVTSFIFISIYLTKYFGNHGLWFSLLCFMILRSLTLKFYFNKILRKF